jgi:hypothetical protein
MNMARNRTTIMMTAVILLGLAIGLVGVLPAFSQAGSHGPDAALAVTESITYQGRLTDNAGNPLSGSHTLRFFLYNVAAGGSPLFDSGDQTVAVADGLFTVALPVPQNRFDGQPLWLRIDVQGQTLSPRQAIRPAPYAMSLRPGAEMRQAATGTALRVESTEGIGLHGSGRVYGIYGASSAPGQGAGYGGYFVSSTGIGVSGRSTAAVTGNNAYAPGVYGYSQQGAGVMGEAGPGAASVAGFFLGNVVVQGNLTVTGSKGGYVVDMALNDGDEPLTPGDLVIVTGVANPVIGHIPVPLVRKADSAGSTAVIGVVEAAHGPHENGAAGASDGAAYPGDYLTIVTLGAFMTIKVDAGYGPVQPGDLLVSSPTPGHAMRADNPQAGTIIGKALSALDEGTGTVAVMVTLQ